MTFSFKQGYDMARKNPNILMNEKNRKNMVEIINQETGLDDIKKQINLFIYEMFPDPTKGMDTTMNHSNDNNKNKNSKCYSDKQPVKLSLSSMKETMYGIKNKVSKKIDKQINKHKKGINNNNNTRKNNNKNKNTTNKNTRKNNNKNKNKNKNTNTNTNESKSN